MVVKSQHIYGSYTFNWKKTNQSYTHHKITKKIEAIHTIKPQLQQNLKWKLQNFINTLFCTYNYFKMWDRRQLNPTYTHISAYRVDNNESSYSWCNNIIPNIHFLMYHK